MRWRISLGCYMALGFWGTCQGLALEQVPGAARAVTKG